MLHVNSHRVRMGDGPIGRGNKRNPRPNGRLIRKVIGQRGVGDQFEVAQPVDYTRATFPMKEAWKSDGEMYWVAMPPVSYEGDIHFTFKVRVKAIMAELPMAGKEYTLISPFGQNVRPRKERRSHLKGLAMEYLRSRGLPMSDFKRVYSGYLEHLGPILFGATATTPRINTITVRVLRQPELEPGSRIVYIVDTALTEWRVDVRTVACEVLPLPEFAAMPWVRNHIFNATEEAERRLDAGKTFAGAGLYDSGNDDPEMKIPTYATQVRRDTGIGMFAHRAYARSFHAPDPWHDAGGPRRQRFSDILRRADAKDRKRREKKARAAATT